MRHKVPTITIGIPAYNEEANIGYLLDEIHGQIQEGFTIERIVVNSDGSDDRTVSIAKNHDRLDVVHVLENIERKGLAFRYNEMLGMSHSTVLVLLNADISIKGESFLKDLVEPILQGGADLTSSSMHAVPPKTFIEKSLYAGMIFKENLFEDINTESNVYTCHGVARAFSERFYKKFHFIGSVGEDAYSYLYCRVHGFSYRYVKRAVAYIKLPDSFHDHNKQSVRFLQSKEAFVASFGNDFLRQEYKIPKWSFLKHLFLASFRSHIFLFSYIAMALFISFRSSRMPIADAWEISTSSKRVHTN